jgi:hypothetical protein
MRGDFPERDWKTFRRLRAIALERFCEQVLSQWRILLVRTKALTNVISAFLSYCGRRIASLPHYSNTRVDPQLLLICRRGLFTAEEMQRFSQEIQERVSEFG